MTDSDALTRFGHRTGFKLIKAAQIGLPVFRVHAACLVVETTPTSLVEEYVLRALVLGIKQPTELCELLGLPRRVVIARLADMLREGLLKEIANESGTTELSITSTGTKLLKDLRRVRPRELELNFTYDGLTHRTVYLPDRELLRPKQIKAAGIPEISAIPAKGPEPANLNVAQVTTYLRDAKPANAKGDLQVLRIIRVDRRERLFLPATALVFRATSGDEYQVAFVIDGRQSHEHEIAFRREGGIERSTVFAALKSGRESIDIEEAVGPELAPFLLESDTQQESARPVLSLKKKAAEKSRTDQIRSAVRQLSVIEHNPLMMQALKEANESLIIISPWVRREVVNEAFLTALRAALARKVRITIGYGIKRSRVDEDMDWQVKKEFDRLSQQFDNFAVKRLGDTHAKILVKDREFFVVTSFNWLSFRGDPQMQFREEWGTLVESRGLTEDFLQQQLHPRLGIDTPA